MTKFIKFLLIALLLSAPSWAQNEELDFRLYNRTQVNIKAIYVSPNNANDWGEDLLHGHMMLNGADLMIQFHPHSSTPVWDLRVEDSEGNALMFEDVDLTSTHAVILNADHTATVKAP